MGQCKFVCNIYGETCGAPTQKIPDKSNGKVWYFTVKGNKLYNRGSTYPKLNTDYCYTHSKMNTCLMDHKQGDYPFSDYKPRNTHPRSKVVRSKKQKQTKLKLPIIKCSFIIIEDQIYSYNKKLFKEGLKNGRSNSSI